MSRSRSDLAHVRRTFRLRHDPATDHVELRLGSPKSQPVAFIPRAYLRPLTDHPHDFADNLDRKDPNA